MRNDIKERRQARAISQADLATAMGVSRQTINSIERYRYVPSLPLAIALARYFGAPVEEVFSDDHETPTLTCSATPPLSSPA